VAMLVALAEPRVGRSVGRSVADCIAGLSPATGRSSCDTSPLKLRVQDPKRHPICERTIEQCSTFGGRGEAGDTIGNSPGTKWVAFNAIIEHPDYGRRYTTRTNQVQRSFEATGLKQRTRAGLGGLTSDGVGGGPHPAVSRTDRANIVALSLSAPLRSRVTECGGRCPTLRAVAVGASRLGYPDSRATGREVGLPVPGWTCKPYWPARRLRTDLIACQANCPRTPDSLVI